MVNTRQELMIWTQHMSAADEKAKKADANARRIQNTALLFCSIALILLVGCILTYSSMIDRLKVRVMNLERHTAQMDAAVTAAEIRIRTLDPSVLEQLEAALLEINRRSISNQRGIQIIRANEERM